MVAAVSAAVMMLAGVASAQIVFSDDFGNSPGGLQGHAADTGQVWLGPLFGVSDGDINAGSGQGGTLGAGDDQNASFMNSVPLNLSANLNPDVDAEGDIIGGVWTLSVDLRRGDDSGELQIGITNPPVAPGGPSWAWVPGGGPCGAAGGMCIQTQGLYGTDNPPLANAPIGFIIGNLHIDTVMDFSGAGSLVHHWENLDTGDKGTIDLGPFTSAANLGELDTIWIAGNSSDGANGLDNIVLRYGLIPEPASMTLLALGGLAMLRRRR
jgi:hypothetical protein